MHALFQSSMWRRLVRPRDLSLVDHRLHVREIRTTVSWQIPANYSTSCCRRKAGNRYLLVAIGDRRNPRSRGSPEAKNVGVINLASVDVEI